MRQFHTMAVCAIILMLSVSTAVNADLSFSAYSFSSLLKTADSVVMGKVTDIKADESAMHMTFDVSETLMGSVSGTIVIHSSLLNGVKKDNNAYLEQGKSYVLYIQNYESAWLITGGVAGVFQPKYADDIRLVSSAYQNNPTLFSIQDIAEIEQVYDSLALQSSKYMFLYCMKGNHSSKSEVFLQKLITDGPVEITALAAVEAAHAKLHRLRPIIESMCEKTNDTVLKQECLIALAQYADIQSLPVIIKHLKHDDSSVRRTAVLAAGIIGNSDVTTPLILLYSKEEDFVQRCEIVTAIGRIKDRKVSISTLYSFKDKESNDVVLAHIADVLKRVSTERNY